MRTIEHLNPEKVEKVAARLWTVSSSLNGLAGLFRYQSSDSCFDRNEFAGIGDLLIGLSYELSRLEDILRCGYDSIAKDEAEKNYEDQNKDEP